MSESRDVMHSPSAAALDRAILIGGAQTLLHIDRLCIEKEGVEQGTEIAKTLSLAAKESPGIKSLMDGGLLFFLKMECIYLQKKKETSIES